MVRRHEFGRREQLRKFIVLKLAAQLADRTFGFEQRSGRMCPKCNNYLGGDEFELTFQIRPAVYNFFRSRVAIFRRTAFDDIADEDFIARQPHRGDDIRQQFARPADKSQSLSVFVGSGAFTDKHQARFWISLSRYGVGAGLTENTFLTYINRCGDLFKCLKRIDFSSFGRCRLGSFLHNSIIRKQGRRDSRSNTGSTNRKIARKKRVQLKVLRQNFLYICIHFKRQFYVNKSQITTEITGISPISKNKVAACFFAELAGFADVFDGGNAGLLAAFEDCLDRQRSQSRYTQQGFAVRLVDIDGEAFRMP